MEDRRTGPRVIRPPNTRRARADRENENEVPIADQMKLDRVLGMTSNSNAAVSVDSHTGVLAYAAGGVVVLFNPAVGWTFPSLSPTSLSPASPGRNDAWQYLNNETKKPISCLAFSPDGRFLATSEFGLNPAVRVWDVIKGKEEAVFIDHNFGVNCVAFSPDQKYLVSIGSQHDQTVNVWDWRAKAKVFSNKVSTKVKRVAFAEDGSYFVTVGLRHVKFWLFDLSPGKKFNETVPINSRMAVFGEEHGNNHYYIDVACGVGQYSHLTFVITKSGILCEFSSLRLLERCVDVRTSRAHAITAGGSYLFIGCADGVIQCFDASTLKYLMTVPRTHHLGMDVSMGIIINNMATQPSDVRFPDCIAICLDESHQRLHAFYHDRSVYVWDVSNKAEVEKSRSFLFHSSGIWGVVGYPTLGEGVKPVCPPGTFFSCASDDTIRVWNLDPEMPENTVFKRNIFSNDLLKMVYIDPMLTMLCNRNPGFDGSPEKKGRIGSLLDSDRGVLCMGISSDGKHLASGDRSGIVRIHELQSMDELFRIEAHDSEVLALHYSQHERSLPGDTKPRSFLATCSRDRVVHVFEVHKDYELAQTMRDHSSATTSVRFAQIPGYRMLLLSCGADKSIVFREAEDPFYPGGEQPPSIIPSFTREGRAARKLAEEKEKRGLPGKRGGKACRQLPRSVSHLPRIENVPPRRGGQGADNVDVARPATALPMVPHQEPRPQPSTLDPVEHPSEQADMKVQFVRYHTATNKNSMYDMAIDVSKEHVVCASHDRAIPVFSLLDGKQTGSLNGSVVADDKAGARSRPPLLPVVRPSVAGQLPLPRETGARSRLVAEKDVKAGSTTHETNIVFDPSGMYVGTSSTDKTICLYKYDTGELLAVVSGHSEIITGLHFTSDCRSLVSVSGDGCIFVWRLPAHVTRASQSRLAQLTNSRQPGPMPSPLRSSWLPARDILDSARNGFSPERNTTNSNTMLGDLPSRVNEQIGSTNPAMRPALSESHVNGDGSGHRPDMPKGQWASQVDVSQSQSLTVRSHHFSDTSIPFPTASSGPHDSESSKNGTGGGGGSTLGRSSENRSKLANLGYCKNGEDDSVVNSLPLEEDETEHEGDIDKDLSGTEESAKETGMNATAFYIPQSKGGNMHFPVNALDKDELNNACHPSNLVSTSVSGSQERDLNADEELKLACEDPSHPRTPSTPTTDPAERNIYGLIPSRKSSQGLASHRTFEGSEGDLNLSSDAGDHRLTSGPALGGGIILRGSESDMCEQGAGAASHGRKSTSVSRQLCEKASSDLCCVARNVIHVHEKVSNDSALSDAERHSMLQCLGQAALKAQEELQLIIAGYSNKGAGAVVPSNPQMPIVPTADPMPGPDELSNESNEPDVDQPEDSRRCIIC